MNPRRSRALGLRGRFLALLAASLIASYLLIGLGTYLVLSRYLTDRLDDQLRAAQGRFAVALEHGDRGPADPDGFDSAPGQIEGTLGARASGGSVTALSIVGRTLSDHDAAALRSDLAALPADGDPVSRTLPAVGDYRLLAIAGRDGDILITGLPERELHDTTATVLLVEAAVLGGALVLTLTAAVPAIRLAARPLTQLTATADQVAAAPMSSGPVVLPRGPHEAHSDTEVGRLSRSFNSMLASVQEALDARGRSDAALREFLADASHELRTPLAIIKGYSELALSEPASADPAAVHDALRRVQSEADRMTELVDDLLMLAQLEDPPAPHAELVDLSVLAVELASDAHATAADHVWRLAIPDEPVTVRGDARQLRQMLLNLVANAALHTPAGTTVLIRLSIDRARQEVEVAVSDDGPGIAASDLPHVFERFRRGGGDAGSAGRGSGLGLAIVAAAARAHHGSVSVSSEPGSTTFRVVLAQDGARLPSGSGSGTSA